MPVRVLAVPLCPASLGEKRQTRGDSFKENIREIHGGVTNKNSFPQRLKSDKQHQLSHTDFRAWCKWVKLFFLSLCPYATRPLERNGFEQKGYYTAMCSLRKDLADKLHKYPFKFQFLNRGTYPSQFPEIPRDPVFDLRFAFMFVRRMCEQLR